MDNTFLPKSKKSERIKRLLHNAVGTTFESDDTEHQRTAQSRSPSLRSSGRNARLWDNPLPEARNPG